MKTYGQKIIITDKQLAKIDAELSGCTDCKNKSKLPFCRSGYRQLYCLNRDIEK